MNNENFKNIVSQQHLLKELAKKKSLYRTTILKKADNNLISAICESIYNILEGNVPLRSDQKVLLIKYKSVLRKLVQRNKIKYKKKLLVQSGGFLGIVLPAVLSLVSSLFD